MHSSCRYSSCRLCPELRLRPLTKATGTHSSRCRSVDPLSRSSPRLGSGPALLAGIESWQACAGSASHLPTHGPQEFISGPDGRREGCGGLRLRLRHSDGRSRQFTLFFLLEVASWMSGWEATTSPGRRIPHHFTARCILGPRCRLAQSLEGLFRARAVEEGWLLYDGMGTCDAMRC